MRLSAAGGAGFRVGAGGGIGSGFSNGFGADDAEDSGEHGRVFLLVEQESGFHCVRVLYISQPTLK